MCHSAVLKLSYQASFTTWNGSGSAIAESRKFVRRLR